MCIGDLLSSMRDKKAPAETKDIAKSNKGDIILKKDLFLPFILTKFINIVSSFLPFLTIAKNEVSLPTTVADHFF